MEQIATTKPAKLARLQAAEKLVGKLFSRNGPYHWWRFLPNGDKIDYWPTTSKWQYQGKMYLGTPNHMIKFLEANGE